MKLRPSAANAPSSHRLIASEVGALTGGIVLLVALSVACTRDAGSAQPSERGGKDVAAAAPCAFTGHWNAVLERPGYQVHGTIDINAKAESLPPGTYAKWRDWRGRYELEWWHLWGPKEGQLNSTSTGSGTEDEIRHGLRASANGDTISITLSPLTSHGPINLWGVWRGDTIRGEWGQRGDLSFVLAGRHGDGPPHGTALLTRPATSCAGRAAAAQTITPSLTELTLRKVATLHDDSVARGPRSSTVFVRPVAAHAAVVRFTIDNPCGVRVRVGVRESPQRTLTLLPIGNWQRPGICPGLVNLETYAATITGLRAGEWRVQADSLMPGTVSGFTIR
jgi:hypothetical protein